MPPPSLALLLVSDVVPLTVSVPAFEIPPPSALAVFSSTIVSTRFAVPLWLSTPPPLLEAELPLTVHR